MIILYELIFNIFFMKKPLHGALVAASLAVGSAQAESPTAPVIDATTQQTANICGDNQTNIVSAKQGHLGCKDIPAPGESIVHSS